MFIGWNLTQIPTKPQCLLAEIWPRFRQNNNVYWLEFDPDSDKSTMSIGWNLTKIPTKQQCLLAEIWPRFRQNNNVYWLKFDPDSNKTTMFIGWNLTQIPTKQGCLLAEIWPRFRQNNNVYWLKFDPDSDKTTMFIDWNLTQIPTKLQCLSFLFLFDQCGDLLDLYDIESCSIYNENYLSPLVQQLLEAVKYMHDLSIVHRNIILQNVLVRSFTNKNKFLF